MLTGSFSLHLMFEVRKSESLGSCEYPEYHVAFTVGSSMVHYAVVIL
jgi:hypothetical protein